MHQNKWVMITITLSIFLITSLVLNFILLSSNSSPRLSVNQFVKTAKDYNKLTEKDQNNLILGLIKKKSFLNFNKSNANDCDNLLSYARIYAGRINEIIARYVVGDVEETLNNIDENMSASDFAMIEAYTGALSEMVDRMDGPCDYMLESD